MVAGGLGTFGHGFRSLRESDPIEVVRCPEGLELEREVEPMRSDELGRPGEQRGSGPGGLLTVDRAVAGGRELGGGTVGKVRVGLPKLGVVADGLFEVVAHDLVVLDQRLAVLVEPVGEARVQVWRGPPWERVVGGVADEEVPEAVGVVSGELGTVWSDELVAHERGESGRQLRLIRGECRTERWKISPSTEPRSSTLRSGSSSWSRRAASTAFSVGGTSTSVFPAAIASISR